MVAFDSDERLKRAVDAIIRSMEGATGMSQQADQPSVTPASAQARTLLPVMERHLRIRCATPDVLAPAAKRPRLQLLQDASPIVGNERRDRHSVKPGSHGPFDGRRSRKSIARNAFSDNFSQLTAPGSDGPSQ